jgi:hypothetical protein
MHTETWDNCQLIGCHKEPGTLHIHQASPQLERLPLARPRSKSISHPVYSHGFERSIGSDSSRASAGDQ